MLDRERNFLGKIGEAIESSVHTVGMSLSDPLVAETAQDVVSEYRDVSVQQFVPLLVQRGLTERLRESASNGKNGSK